jgi:hypothetical protein
MKSLSTQLASWTHMRHDTILYVKQSYGNVKCEYPAGYVEPVPHFWTRLEKTAQKAAELIRQTPYPKSLAETKQNQEQFLRNFAGKVALLKQIAEKELAQKELAAEETKFLKDLVQIQHDCGPSLYTGWYPGLFYESRGDSDRWDALVADVHTNPELPASGDSGCVLHQGVGNVDLLLIAIDNGADRMVFAGPVLSYYEFEMPGAGRKSDAEWRTDLRAGTPPPRPEWTQSYLVPGKNPRAQHYRNAADAGK